MDEQAPQAAASSTGEEAAAQLRSDALAALRFGWGDAYRIDWDPERGWRAQRCDDIGGDITAVDVDGLWNAIREDYDVKPVPRNVGAGQKAVR